MRTSTDPRPAPWDLANGVGMLGAFLPRLLSQIDRDPESPTYGSCDRGFWMYRLHDFDSGVLQQCSLSLACIAKLARALEGSEWAALIEVVEPAYLTDVAKAVNRRTVRLLRDRGFLDEYYPGEASYPGTVFSAYAALKSSLMMEDDEVIRDAGLRRTAEQLIGREASPAANQDVAAAAFLALYAGVDHGRRDAALHTVKTLLAGPDGTARCIEYGGGDLGYSTVSLHFLACMLADETYDCGAQLDEVGSFISDFVDAGGGLGGEFASRSTTYWLPYGLLHAARRNGRCESALRKLDLTSAFARLDDRYLNHYCLPSLALSMADVHAGGPPAVSDESSALPTGEEAHHGWQVAHHRARGLLSARLGDTSLFVGLVKGGAFDLRTQKGHQIDLGYRLSRAGESYATGVIGEDPPARVHEHAGGLEIELEVGFRRYRSLVASPNKTLALRVARGLGPNLNDYFKKRLIKDAETLTGPRLHRAFRLDFETRELVIEDEVSGLLGADDLRRAPPVSLRLVPSARFWQPDEDGAFTRAQPVAAQSQRSYDLS